MQAKKVQAKKNGGPSNGNAKLVKNKNLSGKKLIKKTETQLAKDIKSIEKKLAKAREEYYDLLDLKTAYKALERLEKNGYQTVPAKEVFAKCGIDWKYD